MSKAHTLVELLVALALVGTLVLLAGVPVSSRHPGLSLGTKPPPYYAVARKLDGACLELDTLDLDGDQQVDFVAGQGLITDGGAGLVERVAADSSTLWFRAAAGLPLACGERVVPAVHYEQRGTALWRDGQLALESLSEFGAAVAARAIRIRLAAGEGPARRTIEYERQLPH